MRISGKSSFYCFITSGYWPEPIRKFCDDKVCSACVIGRIKREFFGGRLEIDVGLGRDIGLVGEVSCD